MDKKNLKLKTQKAKVDSKKVRVDLHLKSAAELRVAADELRTEMLMASMNVRAGKEKNTRMKFNKRKLLARTLSVMREKELELKA